MGLADRSLVVDFKRSTRTRNDRPVDYANRGSNNYNRKGYPATCVGDIISGEGHVGRWRALCNDMAAIIDDDYLVLE